MTQKAEKTKKTITFFAIEVILCKTIKNNTTAP